MDIGEFLRGARGRIIFTNFSSLEYCFMVSYTDTSYGTQLVSVNNAILLEFARNLMNTSRFTFLCKENNIL